MAMLEAYLNLVADAGGTAITHIGLIDDQGAEITGGTYARQEVDWTTADDGLIRPDADLEFDIPSGNTVAAWSGFSQLTTGTEYGGEPLTPQEFVSDGTYTLLAAQTGITHSSS